MIVGGAYYPGLRSTDAPKLTLSDVLNVAATLRGGLVDLPDYLRAFATRRTDLRLDPLSGRPFFRVATAAPGANGYQNIDAFSGELLAAWSGVDQVNPGEGTGGKGDTKTLSPDPFNTGPTNLTDKPNTTYLLQSDNNKLITYNAGGGNLINGNPVMTDNGTNQNNDDKWVDPTQAAGVDAQYYAGLTVQFYNQELGYDWLNDCIKDAQHGTTNFPNKVRSVVHYDQSPNSTPYDNAFWDDIHFYMVYGDGSTFDLPLSAGQDVVSHELSHAVTQCNSNLDYQKESGALNESFSDIMATAAEFTLEEPLSSNCRLRAGQTECGDWLIGEDLAKTASGAVIRDMADPEAEGQPSHYEDRSNQGACTPTQGNDECGVHINSGISNHAFYLTVNGGRNARCSGPTDPHDDCAVMVAPTSLDHATKIFFNGFKMLTSSGDFCDARNSTIAQAITLYPNSVTDIAATILAWQAVGLGDNCDASTDFTVSLSDPTLELAPADVGTTNLSLNRVSDNAQINFATDKVGPATVGASPANNSAPNDESGSTVTVTADNDAADGVYPILITATGAGQPHYTAASFVIDAEDPITSVTSARFSTSPQQVSTGGSINLSILWTASDAQSGIASKEVDHSPNGSGWSSIGTTSPTTFATTAGPHQFQVVATDAVGNSTTSAALIRTLTGYQETSATYTGVWATNTEATPWGTTKYSTRRRATATLTFTGTDVVWVAQRGPKRGVANVFVDGVKTHVDLYSTSLTERKVVFIASTLAPGQHTIKVRVRRTSGRPRVDVDGFFVLN